jgi:glycosyltransferase involved in cell wall biosynthesis
MTAGDVLVHYPAMTGWTSALVRAGAEAVTVVQEFHRDEALRADGVEYRFVAGGAGAVARAIARLRPTVVHVNGLVFPVRVRHLRWHLPPDAALLVQDHGGVREEHPGFRSWGWRARHRFGLRAADGFLFTAAALADPWRRTGIIAEQQPVYDVVEASSDLSTTEPDSGASTGEAALPGHPAVLWVGALDANKDPLTILDGFERALARLPDAFLSMVFIDDPLLPEVRRRLAASPRLASQVSLMGRVDHARLAALYRAADLFVLGSRQEASGFALIEAQGFGVTPIVSDIAPFRALTDGGRAGRLFPVGDAPAFARAIEELGATDLRARRALVLTHFERHLSWPAIARRALEVYGEASDRRRTEARRTRASRS